MQPNIIIIDVDGILTDGKVWYDSNGERTKAFHSRDTEAVRELISLGFAVYLLTSSSWPGITHYAKRTGAIVVIERDKMNWINNNIMEPYIAVGDSSIDVEMLRGAAIAFCPTDAMQCVKKIEGIKVLNERGGYGVVAEMVHGKLWDRVDFFNEKN